MSRLTIKSGSGSGCAERMASAVECARLRGEAYIVVKCVSDAAKNAATALACCNCFSEEMILE